MSILRSYYSKNNTIISNLYITNNSNIGNNLNISGNSLFNSLVKHYSDNVKDCIINSFNVARISAASFLSDNPPATL